MGFWRLDALNYKCLNYKIINKSFDTRIGHPHPHFQQMSSSASDFLNSAQYAKNFWYLHVS